jgi:hypothetical protein
MKTKLTKVLIHPTLWMCLCAVLLVVLIFSVLLKPNNVNEESSITYKQYVAIVHFQKEMDKFEDAYPEPPKNFTRQEWAMKIADLLESVDVSDCPNDFRLFYKKMITEARKDCMSEETRRAGDACKYLVDRYLQLGEAKYGKK